MQNMLEKQRMCRSCGIFLKNSRQLLRTNKAQETTQIIRIQGYVDFWTGSFFMNSIIILSYGEYINIYYVKKAYLGQS